MRQGFFARGAGFGHAGKCWAASRSPSRAGPGRFVLRSVTLSRHHVNSASKAGLAADRHHLAVALVLGALPSTAQQAGFLVAPPIGQPVTDVSHVDHPPAKAVSENGERRRYSPGRGLPFVHLIFRPGVPQTVSRAPLICENGGGSNGPARGRAGSHK